MAVRVGTPTGPQSNGKIERRRKTLQADAVRQAATTSLEEARRVIARLNFTASASCRRIIDFTEQCDAEYYVTRPFFRPTALSLSDP